MKQKIEVQVAAAADEQWPRLTSENPANIIGGAQNYVQQTKSQMFLFLGGFTQCIESVPTVMLPQNHYLCFDSMKAAVDWWANPQPVKQEPEKVTIKDLPNGSYFQFEGETAVNVKTGELNGNQLAFQRVGQHFGYAGTALPSLQVVPFYGQITINVEREGNQ